MKDAHYACMTHIPPTSRYPPEHCVAPPVVASSPWENRFCLSCRSLMSVHCSSIPAPTTGQPGWARQLESSCHTHGQGNGMVRNSTITSPASTGPAISTLGIKVTSRCPHSHSLVSARTLPRPHSEHIRNIYQ